MEVDVGIGDLGGFILTHIMSFMALEDMHKCGRVCRDWRKLVKDHICQHPDLGRIWDSPKTTMDICYRVGRMGSDELIRHMYLNKITEIPMMRMQMLLGAAASRSRTTLEYLLTMSDGARDVMAALNLCVIRGDTYLAAWILRRTLISDSNIIRVLSMEAKMICSGVGKWKRVSNNLLYQVLSGAEWSIELGYITRIYRDRNIDPRLWEPKYAKL